MPRLPRYARRPRSAGRRAPGLLLVLLGFAGVPAAVAQTPPAFAFLDQWRHHHRHILAVVDAATPGMLEFRTTPGVRTFAEQIDHIVTVAARIVGAGVADGRMPAALVEDSSRYLHDHALLRARADRLFGQILALLESTPAADYEKDRPLAGGVMPAWRWNLTALQHSAWTLGQTVPYLRMNGRTPPQFTPF